MEVGTLQICAVVHTTRLPNLGSDLGKVRKATYKGHKVFQGRTLPRSNEEAAVRSVVSCLAINVSGRANLRSFALLRMTRGTLRMTENYSK